MRQENPRKKKRKRKKRTMRNDVADDKKIRIIKAISLKMLLKYAVKITAGALASCSVR